MRIIPLLALLLSASQVGPCSVELVVRCVCALDLPGFL